MVISFTCKACIRQSEQQQAKGCQFINYDNQDFVPHMCTGDGGPAQWRQDVP